MKVFITAPMGMGKSTHFIGVLYPYLQTRGHQ